MRTFYGALAAIGMALALCGQAHAAPQVEFLADHYTNPNPQFNLLEAGPTGFTPFAGKLYYVATEYGPFGGQRLHVSDGTPAPAGSKILGSPGRESFRITPVGDRFFLTQADNRTGVNDTGAELWVSNGTAEGTRLVRDIRTGTEDSFPRGHTAYNGKLVFQADDGVIGDELWISDGTLDGTQVLKNINSGPSGSNLQQQFTELGGKLYFQATDSAHGADLWVTDGTPLGTQVVNPAANGTAPREITKFEDKLYFQGGDDTNGRELWVSDGSASGTRLLKNLNPETDPAPKSSTPTEFFEFAGKLYFSASDATNGRELWVTDGTTAGTRLVKDLRAGTPSSFPARFAALRDRLYFGAFDAAGGRELWVTDGTANGTRLVKDINAGAEGSDPQGFTELAGRLYFAAADPVNGRELWATDGTGDGTFLVRDIDPGTPGSFPGELTPFAGKLIFSARDSNRGDELWAVRDDGGLVTPTPIATPAPTPSPAPVPSRVMPVVKGLRKSGRTLRFRLDQNAKVTVTIARKTRGYRSGKRCVARKPKRAAKRCDRFVKAKTVKVNGRTGANTVKLPVKKLRAGRYRATLVATGANGLRSRPIRVAFTR